MNKRFRIRILPWIVGSMLAVSTAFAQNTSSSLSGRVVDSAGQPVVGAIVHVPSGTSRTVITDANGRYAAQGPCASAVRLRSRYRVPPEPARTSQTFI